MSVLVEVEETLKNEIKAAIINAELVDETDIPTIILEQPKDKHMGILQRILRCS